ncbi:MAG: hydrogenase nickel incorporation protein HypB [bacterium]
MSVITIERKVLEKNDMVAALNRELFRSKRIFVINMLSSPGSGKTSLIEKAIQSIGNEIEIAVIEGDVQTDLDAQRISKFNVPVVQIVTNGGCHLEANLVRDAFEKIKENKTDLLIIENVGNLVCPAGYDLGENEKVVIISVTEGDDKPLKYPAMFLKSNYLIINKTDLIPYTDCRLNELKSNALKINPRLKIFDTSCKTGEGIDEWCGCLKAKVR